jgi:hypothetical protein
VIPSCLSDLLVAICKLQFNEAFPEASIFPKVQRATRTEMVVRVCFGNGQ